MPDTALHHLPASKVFYHHHDAKIKSVDEKGMRADFVVVSVNQDRHGDIVEPKGCLKHLDSYKRNPRVFFNHQTTDNPIGSCRAPDGSLALRVFDDRIEGTCYFHGLTKESEQVFALVAARHLEAASVGFRPIRAEPIIENQRQVGYQMVEWELLEWSIVGVPANPRTVAKSQDAVRQVLASGRLAGKPISGHLHSVLKSLAGPPRLWWPGITTEEHSMPKSKYDEVENENAKKKRGVRLRKEDGDDRDEKEVDGEELEAVEKDDDDEEITNKDEDKEEVLEEEEDEEIKMKDEDEDEDADEDTDEDADEDADEGEEDQDDDNDDSDAPIHARIRDVVSDLRIIAQDETTVLDEYQSILKNAIESLLAVADLAESIGKNTKIRTVKRVVYRMPPNAVHAVAVLDGLKMLSETLRRITGRIS